jgi:hypothetical protein
LRPPDLLTNLRSCCYWCPASLMATADDAVRDVPVSSAAALDSDAMPRCYYCCRRSLGPRCYCGVCCCWHLFCADVFTVIDSLSANDVSLGLASLLLLSSPHVPVCLLCCCRPCRDLPGLDRGDVMLRFLIVQFCANRRRRARQESLLERRF